VKPMRLDAPRFRTALVEANSKAHKSGEALCVWWLDVDDCSQLNDAFGERAVDEALSRIDQQLSACGTTFARMEGAAWAAFATMSKVDAQAQAEAWRAAQAGHDSVALSLSVGLACRKKGEPALNLLEAAELACTRAKQGGRGLVVAR